MVTLIGSNGAGKTTTLRSINGILPREGKIVFDGEDTQGTAPLISKGIAQSPEGRKIFHRMTVLAPTIAMAGRGSARTWTASSTSSHA